MPNNSSSNSKRSRPQRTRSLDSNSGRSNVHIGKIANGLQKRKRYIPATRYKYIDKRYLNCLVVYALILFTASILWYLQIPKQVVYVLLVIPILLIPPYLIPLRTQYIKVVYASLALIIVTFLIVVLSFDQKTVLQLLSYLFPVTPK